MAEKGGPCKSKAGGMGVAWDTQPVTQEFVLQNKTYKLSIFQSLIIHLWGIKMRKRVSSYVHFGSDWKSYCRIPGVNSYGLWGSCYQYFRAWNITFYASLNVEVVELSLWLHINAEGQKYDGCKHFTKLFSGKLSWQKSSVRFVQVEFTVNVKILILPRGPDETLFLCG